MSERLAPAGLAGQLLGARGDQGPPRGQDSADRGDARTWRAGTAGAEKSCATGISCFAWAMPGWGEGISR